MRKFIVQTVHTTVFLFRLGHKMLPTQLSFMRSMRIIIRTILINNNFYRNEIVSI